MNELFLFYWFSWIIVIIVYFFYENRYGTKLLLYTLFLTMICVHLSISLFEVVTINVSFMILFISSFLYYAQFRFSYYDFFVVLTVIFCYGALLVWKMITPIWFVIHPMLFIPLSVLTIIVMFINLLSKQIAVIMVSLSIAQLMFDLILLSYGLHDYLGKTDFFIMLWIHFLLLFLYRLLLHIGNILKQTLLIK